jgi:uncharacterized protein YaiL (DUF2058 family)
MASSLLDQLQKTGLVDPRKAKQVVKDKRKQDKVQRKGQQPAPDDNKRQLEQAKAEKIAKDRQLNLARNEKSERKAIAAQIKQLIATHAVPANGDQAFNFSDGKHIKRIYVDNEQTGRLSRGVLAIVKQGEKYIMVPALVADRIAERDPGRIIFKAEKALDIVDEDDPYADYKIPDDLTW